MARVRLIIWFIGFFCFIDCIASQDDIIEAESDQQELMIKKVPSKKLFEDDFQFEDDLDDIFLSNEAVKIYLYLQNFGEESHCNSLRKDSIDVDEDYFLVNFGQSEVLTQSENGCFQNPSILCDDVYRSLGLSYFDGEKEIE